MRRAISTASSGIDYKSNGSIGWSNDKFRAGIKSGAVNGTLGSAGQKSDFLKNNEWARSGMTSFVNKTLDFEEGGWNNVMPGWMPGLIKDKEALIRSNPGEGNPERFKHWHIVKNEGKETWDFHHDPYDATDGYSGLLGHALSDNLKVFIEKKVKKIIKK